MKVNYSIFNIYHRTEGTPSISLVIFARKRHMSKVEIVTTGTEWKTWRSALYRRPAVIAVLVDRRFIDENYIHVILIILARETL